MTLVTQVKYESPIKEFKDISPDSILNMLKNVRADIRRIDPNFTNADLLKVLKVVEAGEYEINGSVSTRVDLSSAKEDIEAYRKYSEGGCQSCVSLGRETIDAQDGESGWYCQIDDPDYDKIKGSYSIGCKYRGRSKKTKRYYDSPCESWKPRFSPKLEELIKN